MFRGRVYIYERELLRLGGLVWRWVEGGNGGRWPGMKDIHQSSVKGPDRLW